MSEKYSEITLKELKLELKKRNAKTTGRKKELIDRLEAYDRNNDFNNAALNQEPEYNMKLPDHSMYTDIHGEKKFVPLDLAKINYYLTAFDKKIEATSVYLYKEKYLRYLRLCNTDSLLFVRGACRAEMKKYVSYIIDISLSKDGHVKECQCDCGAGMGPGAHCKHVCAVLYACSKFVLDGEVLKEETCTQKLQAFHRVKKYAGSPLKSCDINMPGAGEIANANFDPRKNEYISMPSYPDFFRNAVLNFPGSHRMPIFQLYRPANAFAVAHDHDYLKLTPEDMYLKQIRVEDITKLEIDNIEKDTKGQSTNQRWHSERRMRISSSNFGRICKATEKTDFHKMASSFVTKKPDIKSEPVRHGLKYEKEAIKAYENTQNSVVKSCGFFISDCMPFIGASPDGVVNQKKIVEVKCPFTARNKPINPQTVPYLAYVEGKLQLKRNHDYFYQVQGQLLCTNRDECDFLVYTITDMKCITISRDDVFISDMVKN